MNNRCAKAPQRNERCPLMREWAVGLLSQHLFAQNGALQSSIPASGFIFFSFSSCK